jgi:hypothetical protein
VPDQRSLLRGRLANAIDDVADVAQHLGPPATHATAPTPPPPPLESVGRAWTLEAAMEPIPDPVAARVDTIRSTSSLRPPEPPPYPEHHASRAPLVIIGSSLLGILLVIGVAVRLFSGGAAVQAPPHATEQISLTGVRPVATAAAQAGAVPVTQVSFPAKTPVVNIEVNSGGTAGQEPVEIAVSLGEPAHTISKNEYVLSQSGDTVIPLSPPGSSFAPGNYSVTITYRGALLGSTSFAVR